MLKETEPWFLQVLNHPDRALERALENESCAKLLETLADRNPTLAVLKDAADIVRSTCPKPIRDLLHLAHTTGG